MSFFKCLKTGQKYESLSIDILKKYNFKHIILDGSKNSYYDITATYNNKTVYIECKYNSLINKTSKVFLECSSHKKDVHYSSGLSITRANYYIIFSNTHYYIIETTILKKLLKKTIKQELKFKGHTNPTNNDLLNYIINYGIKTTNTTGILIKLKLIIKNCIYTGSIYNKTKYNKRLV